MTCRTGLPVPCRQCPGALCPTGRLPRFLTGPDAPFPTDPDGPTGRFLLYPTGPDGRTDRFPRFLTDPDAPFPTDRDGLTGPFLPDLFLPDPFLPGPFRLYAPTGPGTGVQSCPASFFRSPMPGRYRITVYQGNDMRLPLVDTWMNFRQNQDYTVALIRSGSNFRLQTSSF